jgi:Protein of Unknown function (DUF2784)
MVYRWLATAALALHFGYMAYLVLGGFVAWRWPRTIWLHLGAVVWGLLIISGKVDCPLTYAENWARERAGLTRLSQGFVDRFLDNVIYPAQYVNVARLGVAIVVGVSWAGVYLQWRKRRARRATQAQSEPKSGERDGRAATV